MQDSRIEAYARLLVERCVDVQAGWQVLVFANPLARPLLEEVVRLIARRGAYALVRIRFAGAGDPVWLAEAPEALLRELPPIHAHELDTCDCYVVIEAPENTRDGSEIPAGRLQLWREAMRPHVLPFLADEKPWVGCQFPTAALAQDAGMTLAGFEEFLYGAVLIDWDELERRMERIAERFDAAGEIRLIGEGTDLAFSLAGRRGMVSAADANMPSGEVFYSPIEDSAEGVVTFGEYPACYLGHAVEGVRLVFERGRVVEASAKGDEEFLVAALDTDEGARVLGEFGIGCNPGIQRHMKNTLFDEKIEGTVHLALGHGFPQLGGSNVSAIHWDMVKDLRNGGRLYADGELVQENGEWLL